MKELDVFSNLEAIEQVPQFNLIFGNDSERSHKLASHKAWLASIRHERPNVTKHFRVGIYIRYFNQTKYENYLSYHRKQFQDSIDLCPNWELVGFYVDHGASAPNMESAPELSRLLNDCMDGKIDLIITQKLSNVSKSMDEITICARILASQQPPIGIYFISEDIFTLASYYLEDLKDPYFSPEEEIETWSPVLLPDGEHND